MAVTFKAEYYYIDGVQQSSPSYGLAGYNTNNRKYYISVAKYYTDAPISAPTFGLRSGGEDNTNKDRQLGVYFVACSANSTPDNTIITTPSYIAQNHQTRIRFAYTYDPSNGSFTSAGNSSWGYGKTGSDLIIPPGYFFVYIGTAQATLHTYSSHYTINSSYYPATLTYSTPQSYTISYNANGGSGTMDNQIKYAGIDLTLHTNSFTAPDSTKTTQTITLKRDSATVGTKTTTNTTPKVFSEWNTNSAGTGTSYNAGASYTTNADATMYAQWTDGALEKERIVLGSTTKSPTSSSLTLTLELQDGLGITYPLTKTINYTFNSWNTRTNGSGTYFDSTTHYSFVTDATLYAIFDSSEVLPTVNLPTNIIRDGYTFKGWSINSTGSPLINGNTYQPSSDTTLYAVWEGSGIEDGMYVYQASDQAWHKVASFTI